MPTAAIAKAAAAVQPKRPRFMDPVLLAKPFVGERYHIFPKSGERLALLRPLTLRDAHNNGRLLSNAKSVIGGLASIDGVSDIVNARAVPFDRTLLD